MGSSVCLTWSGVIKQKNFLPLHSFPACRPGESPRAGEEENPSDHLHRLPPLLRRGLPRPAGERSDWSGGRPAEQQASASRGGHLPRDGRHQESEAGAAGESDV